MTQVVILGFDGLDADLLRVYGPALPHLRRLMLESPFLELTSCIPPDTVPAWGSLYTGLNPANHGLLSLPISGLTALVDHETGEPPALTCGTTFWDLASASGKRICVLNPYLAYPAWPVNGIMLALSPGDGSMSIAPEEHELSLVFPALPRLTEQATRREQLRTFYHELVSCTLQQAALGLELLQQERWDLFFLQLNALDMVQHLFWHYSDLSDPAYPGQSEHLTRIPSFYRLCDHIVGEVRTALPAESILIVVSAYGHGRRSHQRVNLNEWLRRQGLLMVQAPGPRLLERPFPVRARRYLPLDELLIHASPGTRERRPSARSQSRLIDEERSLARAFSLGGDGPFGGVALNRQGLEEQGRDYEEMRAFLQEEIQRLCSRGRPLLRWVRKREEVYQGRYLERLPDLLFELQGDFAIGDDLYVPLLTTPAARRTVSGTHRKDGVLLIGNLLHHEPRVNDLHEITVMDVAPTVLSLLGINNAVRFDGQPLLALRTAESLS
ncbi:alkaline phosphatase family protein [Thermogemmatispora carboxidivorans]|uniref:alkaline phosphatase family protein n=1 Tax=Thermogemmatispora carboxidivorans TaxID=1382306 RepID=UPI00069A592A|nr:alkaline phosphatase family protein [Thermogemmatispora carboxidivorans]